MIIFLHFSQQIFIAQTIRGSKVSILLEATSKGREKAEFYLVTPVSG
jgi:hypothetical protein